MAEIGKNVTAVQGDVSKLEDLDRLYYTVAEQGRKIDVVVANAAFVEIAPLKTATREHFDRTFDTNARGAFSRTGLPPRVFDGETNAGPDEGCAVSLK